MRVNLTRLDLTTTGLSLYHADIRTGLTGMNPFTGQELRLKQVGAEIAFSNPFKNYKLQENF